MFTFEIANAIWRKFRGGVLSFESAIRAVEGLTSFRVDAMAPPNLVATALDVNRRLGAGAIYDALYLALARILVCELWTADSRLASAARAARLGIEVRELSAFSGF